MKSSSALNFIILSLLICMITTSSGCAISDEGATDYRYYHPSNNTPVKYIKPSDIKFPIKPGEALEVSLKQVYIDDFTEFASPLRIVRNEPANGEIALVVNAFEKGKGKYNFGPEGLTNARVVFFSDDVWEGQPLNLSNLSTIYGPLKYEGNSFIIDLYIVEFDQPSEQLKQLVANLSEIGSTFYPPAAPIAGAVSKLAGSLITDQQEDRIFHYTFELKPLGGDLNLHTGLLQTGNYAFIREKDRKKTTDWSQLAIQPETGRMVYKNKKFKINKYATTETACNSSGELPSECYYKENTYVVIEINKANSSLKNDTVQMIYKDLVADLAGTSPEIFTTTIPEDTLKNLTQGVSQMRNSELINNALNILKFKDVTVDNNNTALTNFMDLWFHSEGDAPQITSKYKITSLDQQRIERSIAELISSCEDDQEKIISIMQLIRNRTRKLTDHERKITLRALSCKHN